MKTLIANPITSSTGTSWTVLTPPTGGVLDPTASLNDLTQLATGTVADIDKYIHQLHIQDLSRLCAGWTNTTYTPNAWEGIDGDYIDPFYYVNDVTGMVAGQQATVMESTGIGASPYTTDNFESSYFTLGGVGTAPIMYTPEQGWATVTGTSAGVITGGLVTFTAVPAGLTLTGTIFAVTPASGGSNPSVIYGTVNSYTGTTLVINVTYSAGPTLTSAATWGISLASAANLAQILPSTVGNQTAQPVPLYCSIAEIGDIISMIPDFTFGVLASGISTGANVTTTVTMDASVASEQVFAPGQQLVGATGNPIGNITAASLSAGLWTITLDTVTTAVTSGTAVHAATFESSSPFAITSATYAAGVLTFTFTGAPSQFVAGQTVVTSGFTPSAYNGSWVAASVSATGGSGTFTVTTSATPSAATVLGSAYTGSVAGSGIINTPANNIYNFDFTQVPWISTTPYSNITGTLAPLGVAVQGYAGSKGVNFNALITSFAGQPIATVTDQFSPANPPVSGSSPSPSLVTLSSYSCDSYTAVCTSSSPHYYSTGQTVYFEGFTTTTSINGAQGPITVIDATTFSFPCAIMSLPDVATGNVYNPSFNTVLSVDNADSLAYYTTYTDSTPSLSFGNTLGSNDVWAFGGIVDSQTITVFSFTDTGYNFAASSGGSNTTYAQGDVANGMFIYEYGIPGASCIAPSSFNGSGAGVVGVVGSNEAHLAGMGFATYNPGTRYVGSDDIQNLESFVPFAVGSLSGGYLTTPIAAGKSKSLTIGAGPRSATSGFIDLSQGAEGIETLLVVVIGEGNNQEAVLLSGASTGISPDLGDNSPMVWTLAAGQSFAYNHGIGEPVVKPNVTLTSPLQYPHFAAEPVMGGPDFVSVGSTVNGATGWEVSNISSSASLTATASFGFSEPWLQAGNDGQPSISTTLSGPIELGTTTIDIATNEGFDTTLPSVVNGDFPFLPNSLGILIGALGSGATSIPIAVNGVTPTSFPFFITIGDDTLQVTGTAFDGNDVFLELASSTTNAYPDMSPVYLNSLDTGSVYTSVDVPSFYLMNSSFSGTLTGEQVFINGSVPSSATGLAITGTGIAPGTTVAAVDTTTVPSCTILTLSTPATTLSSGAVLLEADTGFTGTMVNYSNGVITGFTSPSLAPGGTTGSVINYTASGLAVGAIFSVGGVPALLQVIDDTTSHGTLICTPPATNNYTNNSVQQMSISFSGGVTWTASTGTATVTVASGTTVKVNDTITGNSYSSPMSVVGTNVTWAYNNLTSILKKGMIVRLGGNTVTVNTVSGNTFTYTGTATAQTAATALTIAAVSVSGSLMSVAWGSEITAASALPAVGRYIVDGNKWTNIPASIKVLDSFYSTRQSTQVVLIGNAATSSGATYGGASVAEGAGNQFYTSAYPSFVGATNQILSTTQVGICSGTPVTGQYISQGSTISAVNNSMVVLSLPMATSATGTYGFTVDGSWDYGQTVTAIAVSPLPCPIPSGSTLLAISGSFQQPITLGTLVYTGTATATTNTVTNTSIVGYTGSLLPAIGAILTDTSSPTPCFTSPVTVTGVSGTTITLSANAANSGTPVFASSEPFPASSGMLPVVSFSPTYNYPVSIGSEGVWSTIGTIITPGLVDDLEFGETIMMTAGGNSQLMVTSAYVPSTAIAIPVVPYQPDYPFDNNPNGVTFTATTTSGSGVLSSMSVPVGEIAVGDSVYGSVFNDIAFVESLTISSGIITGVTVTQPANASGAGQAINTNGTALYAPPYMTLDAGTYQETVYPTEVPQDNGDGTYSLTLATPTNFAHPASAPLAFYQMPNGPNVGDVTYRPDLIDPNGNQGAFQMFDGNTWRYARVANVQATYGLKGSQTALDKETFTYQDPATGAGVAVDIFSGIPSTVYSVKKGSVLVNDPNGNEWTENLLTTFVLNASVLVPHATGNTSVSTPSTVFIRNISMAMTFTAEPLVTEIGFQPANNMTFSTTSSNVITWTYDDMDNQPQTAWDVRIFTNDQYDSDGFDPDSSDFTPFYEASGNDDSTATTLQGLNGFVNGDLYWVFIRVAKNFYSNTWFGKWASDSFIALVEQPQSPILSVGSDVAEALTGIYIQSTDNLLGQNNGGFTTGIGGWTKTANDTAASVLEFGAWGVALAGALVQGKTYTSLPVGAVGAIMTGSSIPGSGIGTKFKVRISSAVKDAVGFPTQGRFWVTVAQGGNSECMWVTNAVDGNNSGDTFTILSRNYIPSVGGTSSGSHSFTAGATVTFGLQNDVYVGTQGTIHGLRDYTTTKHIASTAITRTQPGAPIWVDYAASTFTITKTQWTGLYSQSVEVHDPQHILGPGDVVALVYNHVTVSAENNAVAAAKNALGLSGNNLSQQNTILSVKNASPALLNNAQVWAATLTRPLYGSTTNPMSALTGLKAVNFGNSIAGTISSGTKVNIQTPHWPWTDSTGKTHAGGESMTVTLSHSYTIGDSVMCIQPLSYGYPYQIKLPSGTPVLDGAFQIPANSVVYVPVTASTNSSQNLVNLTFESNTARSPWTGYELVPGDSVEIVRQRIVGSNLPTTSIVGYTKAQSITTDHHVDDQQQIVVDYNQSPTASRQYFSISANTPTYTPAATVGTTVNPATFTQFTILSSAAVVANAYAGWLVQAAGVPLGTTVASNTAAASAGVNFTITLSPPSGSSCVVPYTGITMSGTTPIPSGYITETDVYLIPNTPPYASAAVVPAGSTSLPIRPFTAGINVPAQTPLMLNYTPFFGDNCLVVIPTTTGATTSEISLHPTSWNGWNATNSVPVNAGATYGFAAYSQIANGIGTPTFTPWIDWYDDYGNLIWQSDGTDSLTYGPALSASSQSVTTGSKTFALTNTAQFTVGENVYVFDWATPSNYLYGSITSIAANTSITVNVATAIGSGTGITTWRVASFYPGININVPTGRYGTGWAPNAVVAQAPLNMSVCNYASGNTASYTPATVTTGTFSFTGSLRYGLKPGSLLTLNSGLTVIVTATPTYVGGVTSIPVRYTTGVTPTASDLMISATRACPRIQWTNFSSGDVLNLSAAMFKAMTTAYPNVYDSVTSSSQIPTLTAAITVDTTWTSAPQQGSSFVIPQSTPTAGSASFYVFDPSNDNGTREIDMGGANETLHTSLVSACDIGDSSVVVKSTVGLAVGGSFIIGYTEDTQETVVVSSAWTGGTTVALASPTWNAHSAGEQVLAVTAGLAAPVLQTQNVGTPVAVFNWGDDGWVNNDYSTYAYLVERSDDQGNTWSTVRGAGALKSDNTGLAWTIDTEVIPGNVTLYRATPTVTDSTGTSITGKTLVPFEMTAPTSTNWWLSSTSNPSMRFPIAVKNQMNETQKHPVGVSYPLGSHLPYTTAGAVQGRDYTLVITWSDDANWQNFLDMLRLGETMVLTNPVEKTRSYIFVSEDASFEHNAGAAGPYRLVTLTCVEVAPPNYGYTYGA